MVVERKIHIHSASLSQISVDQRGLNGTVVARRRLISTVHFLGESRLCARADTADIGALQALLNAAAIGEGRGWARTIDGKDLSQLSWGLKKRPVEMKEPQSDSIEPQALTIQS
jgi:hypothetical protein